MAKAVVSASERSSTAKSAIDTLELAFALAETDLDSLGQRPLQRVKREIDRFIRAAPSGEPGSDTGDLWVGGGGGFEPPSDVEVFSLQRAVRALLNAVARRGPLGEHELWRPAIRPVVRDDGSVLLAVDEGSVHDRYMLALVARLQHLGADRVRACGVCGRAFLRRTRALYCGLPECRRKVVLAGWHRNKAKYRPTKKGATKSRKASSTRK